MKSLEVEDNVVKGPTPRKETSVPQVQIYQAYTYYLGEKSIHVCIPQCTHVYTSVYTRVHNLALSMSPQPPFRISIPRANARCSRDMAKAPLGINESPQGGQEQGVLKESMHQPYYTSRLRTSYPTNWGHMIQRWLAGHPQAHPIVLYPLVSIYIVESSHGQGDSGSSGVAQRLCRMKQSSYLCYTIFSM